MKRLGQFLLAVAVVGVVTGGASAQERKLIPPIRGEATLDITKPNTKLVGGEVVTVIIGAQPEHDRRDCRPEGRRELVRQGRATRSPATSTATRVR